MMNITEILNGYLLDNVLEGYDVIYNDVFPDDENESIISRYDPSTANETEYIDGSADGSQSLAYLVRSQRAEKARGTLAEILECVDGLSCETEGGTEIRFEGVTLPTFVSVDDKNNTVYSLEITAKYKRKG